MTKDEVAAPAELFAKRQLEVLAIRAAQLAERAASGQIRFIDAVEIAYSAAECAGLVDAVGDDAVQLVLAAAFATARPGQ